MKFEIDVSGYDIFNDGGYVICIANGDKETIKWFKFSKDLMEHLKLNWKKGGYKYGLSNKQRGFLKVRLYSIIIYYLFKSIKENIKEEIELKICKDFPGHKNDINVNLKNFIEKLLSVKIRLIRHEKLPRSSNAHLYAHLINKDKYNLFTYNIHINLEDIEKYLKK